MGGPIDFEVEMRLEFNLDLLEDIDSFFEPNLLYATLDVTTCLL